MQKQRLFADYLDRAKAPSGSSHPQSVSPLYPKTKALGFTGLSHKHAYPHKSKSGGLRRVQITSGFASAIFRLSSPVIRANSPPKTPSL